MRLPRRALLSVALGAAAMTATAGSSEAISPAPRPTTAPRTLAPSSVPLALGAYSQGMDKDPTVLDRTASALGRPMAIASVFRGKGDDAWWPYPADRALGTRRTLLVAWSLEDYGSYAWWASGQGDAVLRDKARTLRAYGRPVVLRPWAEMNADWVAHQVTTGTPKPAGGSPDQFRAAWRRAVDVFRREGASNVRWAFNPTTDTYAGTSDVRAFYPGDDVVDVLGLDGYNWGTTATPNLGWRTFDDVYATQYARLVGLAPAKPVWLCEISSADPASAGVSTVRASAPTGQTKGLWWQDTFAHLRTGYRNVQAVVVFDVDKERDWRVASSAEALGGLRTAVSSPIYKPRLG
ncbi:glycoside hydrolase family 26 protein [Arsenicicoccus dermatophilus]|uniref:glycoside hydrolase family 26 protein n=1 Tax=Arsenicicoccus dermatophilus TaxID=1076331 RepID=UPI001F4C8C1D|nr:glycosyl hydrolase [Arsenicicoccus dermatophilus]MCH8612915.1 hypothetical protein [Arsenicicoccus dermatophilus]